MECPSQKQFLGFSSFGETSTVRPGTPQQAAKVPMLSDVTRPRISTCIVSFLPPSFHDVRPNPSKIVLVLLTGVQLEGEGNPSSCNQKNFPNLAKPVWLDRKKTSNYNISIVFNFKSKKFFLDAVTISYAVVLR